MSASFKLERDAFGHLVLIEAEGVRHVGVVPVRAFPLSAPDEGLSLVGSEGRELLWIDRLADLPEPARALLAEDLAARDFAPMLLKLHRVSSFGVPSTWTVSTDRGDARFVLKAEEDIRRLEGGALLIASAHGVQFRIPDVKALDRGSRKLLERFL
ncbi:hypothetical protein WDL1CHR_04581 [Variovorax sp. WDL1]|nr:DUF1854 domain-containing protein [Variovorax sp. WDL1]PNG60015.1 hypothetical protein CHC07_01744 [Variovorax sp. B4]PNG60192.1 hypothetical protein CHC06_00089 [Variovorax sp. B2]VTV13979.1 hypothetical protein WDL1CHR_04581 [Variovorax sp. WDL1]